MLHWIGSASSTLPATSGTVMLAALPIIIGIQFLMAFLHYDMESVPSEPLSALLPAGGLQKYQNQI